MAWYSYAIIAAVAIAAVGLLQKRNLQVEHSTEYVTLFSAAKLLIFLLLFGTKIEWRVTAEQFVWLVLNGMMLSLAFYFIAKAMRRQEISTVMPVLSLEAGLVALLALIFLGEKIHGGQWLGLSLMLIGTYVLELRHQTPGLVSHWSPRHIFDPLQRLVHQPGGSFAIAGLICFSISSVLDRFNLLRVPLTTYLAYLFTTMTIFYTLRFFAIKEKLVVFQRGRRLLMLSIIAIAGLHLLSNYSQAKATALAAVGLVIALKRLSTLLDVIIGGRFFHERNLMQKTVASLIMLIGVYFVVAT